MKYIPIEKDYSIKLYPKVVDYLIPDTIYIPITKDYRINIDVGSRVLKEQQVAINSKNIIFSPISGIVLGIKKMVNSNNKEIITIVIKNDFMEQLFKKNKTTDNIKKYKKDELLQKLKDYSILDMYNYLNNIKNILVINAIEDEIYVGNKSMILSNMADSILDTLDALISIFSLKQVYLFIKSSDSLAIEKLYNKIGRYLNIKLRLIPESYSLENNDAIKYNFFSNSKNVSILSLEDIIVLFNIMKKGKMTTKKYITISGKGVIKPKVINVRIGSSVKDIIEHNIKIRKDKNYSYIVNGLIKGISMPVDDLIVTKDLNSIIIDTIIEYEENKCINCGLCKEVCPTNVDPKRVMDLIKKKKKNGSCVKQCIHCNLCSYICPAKINLNKYLNEMGEE